jgi:hypothetical protein
MMRFVQGEDLTMSIVERVKGMLISPRAEWAKVAAEPMTVQGIYTGYVMILAAIAPLAMLVGFGSVRFAIANYLTVLVMTAVIALIVDFLAPHFGGSKDFVGALKLSAFSYTPAYLGGILHLLGAAGGLLILLAALYAYYLFYLGAPVLKKSAPEKALVFTIAVVIVGFVIGMLLGITLGRAGLAPAM